MTNKASQKIFADRWRIIRELGSGEMGKVYLAEGEKGELAAIKVLGFKMTARQQERIARFKSEFSILKKLSHPGINRVYDFGRDIESGSYFFTSEYVEGRPFLKVAETLSVDLVEELFVQVLRALEYLHSRGIMHGDLKSANVLVQKGEGGRIVARLIDFGLAILGSPDRIVGTPSYMAPEIILKKNPDDRADLYSLGVLIYSALAGFNPFKAGSISETFEKHLNAVLAPPSRFNDGVKGYLDEIILKLLKVSPDERYPTAADVIRAIDHGGGKTYPVETKETFLGYLPAGGLLIGRERQMEEAKRICLAARNMEPGAPIALCIKGEMGTGKKMLLRELKYFAQLNEMDVVDLKSTGEKGLSSFNDALSRLIGSSDRPALVTCDFPGTIAVRKEARRTIELLRRSLRWAMVAGAQTVLKRKAPLLFAFAAAPDELPLLLGLFDVEETGLKTIELNNFDVKRTKDYLVALTGVGDPPEPFVDELFKRTRGNPLFITEVLKGLAGKGMLFDKVGRWDRENMEDIGVRFEAIAVPGSLNGILEGAYKGALPEEQGVLEALCVWQRPATLGEIEGAAGMHDIRRILLDLVGSGNVKYDGVSFSYAFLNPLFKEVVYEKMPPARKAWLHRAVVKWLKTTRPEAKAEIDWHIGKCGDTREAVDALLELGEFHMKEGRIFDAISAFSDAKECSKKTGYRYDESLLHLGEAFVLARRYPEAIRIYGELLSLRESGGVASSLSPAVICQRLGTAYIRNGDLEKGREMLQRAKQLLEETGGDDALKLKVDNLLARILFLEGRLDEAIEIYEDTKRKWKVLPDEEKVRVLNNDLAHAYLQRGDLAAAEAQFKEDIGYFGSIGENGELKRSYYAVAELYREKGYLDKAVPFFERAIEIAKETFDAELLLRAYNGLGNLFIAKKDVPVAVYWYERGLDLALRTGDDRSAAAISANIGRIKAKDSDKEVSVFDIHAGAAVPEGNATDRHYRYILEINKYLSGETDLSFIFKTILKYAIELSNAEGGLILLAEDDGSLSIRSSCNISVDDKLSEVGTSIARRAMEDDKVVITRDALTDERFKEMESVVLLGLKSVMCVPIHSKKRVVGVLYMENRSKPGAFDGMDKDMIVAFADQTGMAIENARLLAAYDASEKSLKEELGQSCLKLERLDLQVRTQVCDLKKRHQFDKIVSTSPGMKVIFDLLKRISDTGLSVLITGESGTGKELVARAVHYNSGRNDKPFIAVNCSAIPATLMESEFFGYKAGAFTGAVRDKAGLFEAAHGGTVFLDEIADLDISLQSKLLRVIQEREFTRVGDTKPVRCDVRMVCATNKNPEKMAEEGKFRQDLYYRIAEIKVNLMPLRERIEDIPLLIDEFITEYCSRQGVRDKPKVGASFVRACMTHNWPGNIRELENAVRVAVALADEGELTLAALPDGHVLKKFEKKSAAGVAVADSGPKTTPIDEHNLYDPSVKWGEYEARIIAAAYKVCEFNAGRTAENLKMPQATIYKKIREHKLRDGSNPLFAVPFRYEPGTSFEEHLINIFKAAWERSGRHPYKAAKLLGVSHGYFYKVMKKFAAS